MRAKGHIHWLSGLDQLPVGNALEENHGVFISVVDFAVCPSGKVLCACGHPLHTVAHTFEVGVSWIHTGDPGASFVSIQPVQRPDVADLSCEVSCVPVSLTLIGPNRNIFNQCRITMKIHAHRDSGCKVIGITLEYLESPVSSH